MKLLKFGILKIEKIELLPYTKKMFKYLGENLKDKTALEIGSGDGLLATLLSKDLKKNRLYWYIFKDEGRVYK